MNSYLQLATCGFFIISNGKLLLVHPTKTEHLSIPKGQLDDNENYLEAAIRELKEETGINFNDLHILDMKQITAQVYKNKKKVLHSFLVITDTYINIKDLVCTTYVYDKNGVPLYPENDKFFLVDLYDQDFNKYFLKLHHTQKQALMYIYKYLHKKMKKFY